jgi:ubiquinone/menaquinone biosynthesis C-methylase UbiE
MSARKSNLERIDWAIFKLDIKPDERVLEIGYGPGIALGKMMTHLTTGMIWGTDRSKLMFRQAGKRNVTWIKTGRMKLFLGSVASLPVPDFPFDKALDINSFQFWERPVESLIHLRKALKSGAMVELVHQPRNPGATDQDAREAGEKFSSVLRAAGFLNVVVDINVMKPVAAVCIQGYNP